MTATAIRRSTTSDERGRDLPPGELEAALCEHHADGFGWALACCAWDPAEAEDVLQTSYEKLLDGRARFEGRASFRTWLFGVIRLTALERRRRLRVRARALTRWLERQPPLAPSDPVGDVEVRERNARLRDALAALPARQREVLHLVFYSGLTIEAAGRVMGVALGTARTHYQRGCRSLRARLAREET